LLLEVTDAAIAVWGASRVGVHLAPRCDNHTMGDSNPLATFGYVADQLGKRGIAFIFTRESLKKDRISPELKKRFGGILIANEGLTLESAQQLLDAGDADAISFGKDFISNPNLPHRLRMQVPLNPFDTTTFFHSQADPRVGYTDYPI
jgi:2,4-dienoyl-CoA reductase-like NADH-dependent reductase (Old Yellow Enzyme family)